MRAKKQRQIYNKQQVVCEEGKKGDETGKLAFSIRTQLNTTIMHSIFLSIGVSISNSSFKVHFSFVFLKGHNILWCS
jgi:hypothetical protein